MLKKSITYNNFDGDTVTEDFYFNMTKAELVELAMSENEDLSETLQRIVQANDGAQIISYFKKIILMSYGEKSLDGKRFLKSDEMANSFSHTEAYSVLFMELSTNADAAAVFVNGIMPSDLMVEASAITPASTKTIKPIETLVGPGNPEPKQKPIEELTREELEALLRVKESQ